MNRPAEQDRERNDADQGGQPVADGDAAEQDAGAEDGPDRRRIGAADSVLLPLYPSRKRSGPGSGRIHGGPTLVRYFQSEFLTFAISSKAVRSVLASLMASSLAQKCMKKSRGSSSSM